MNESEIPGYSPSEIFPTTKKYLIYQKDDILIDCRLHRTDRDNEAYFVAPKEVKGFPITPPMRIVRAFDSDKLKSEVLMPDTVGCTPMGSESYFRIEKNQVSSFNSVGCRHLAFWYSPQRREEIAQEMSISTIEFPFEHNLPALLPAREIRQCALDFLSNGFQGGKLVAESLVNLTIINMLEVLDKNLRKKQQKLPELTPARLARIKEFIEENLGQNIGVNDLGDIAGISSFHVLKCFQRAVGKSPQEYLLERRIERAKKLLATSKHTIADIAVYCGFSSSNQMARVFKRELGMTPSLFRVNA